MKFLVSVLPFLVYADTPTQNYERLCGGCHGAMGSGGRAPALDTAFRRVSDQSGLESLIRAGVPGTEMPPTPDSRLSNSDLKELAAWIWTLRKTEVAAEVAQIRRGHAVFAGKGNCTKCHSIQGEGGVLGPDLSGIGNARTRDHMLTSLLDPQAYISDSFENYRWTIDIPDNFLQVRVVTKLGLRITGGRVNEDSFSIQVRAVDGKLHSFLKSELAELKKDWGVSPMPSYKDTLSADELKDLVNFLAAQRRGR